MRSTAIVAVVLVVLGVLEVRCQDQCPAQQTCTLGRAVTLPAVGNVSSTFYLGGLFDVFEKGDGYTCGRTTRESGVMNMMAFFWAISRYRYTSGLSPNVGGVVFDTCERHDQALLNVMGFEQCSIRVANVDRRQVMAFVGPQRSDQAMVVAKLTQDLKITTVSPAATAAQLSDASTYPYFLRTVPSDVIDADIIAAMFDKESFRYLMVVYQDDAYGRAGMKRLREHFPGRQYGSDKCISYSASLPVDPTPEQINSVVSDLLERYLNRYVVLFLSPETTRAVLTRVGNVPASAGKLRFLGTSMWGLSSSVIQNLNHVTNNSQVIVRSVRGSDYSTALQDFKNYWNQLKPTNQNEWFKKYWEETFRCSLQTTNNACDVTSQTLSSRPLDTFVPYTLMAVDVALNGIRSAAEGACNNQFTLCSALMNVNNRGSNLFEGIKRQSRSGTPIFDLTTSGQNYVTGDVSAGFTMFKIYRIVNGAYVEAGEYTGSTLTWQKPLSSQFYPAPTCTSSPCVECGEPVTTTARVTNPVQTTSSAPKTTTNPVTNGNVTMVGFPPGQQITGAYSTAIRHENEYGTRFDLGHKWIIALGVLAGLGIVAVIVFEIYILMKLLGSNFIHKWRTMWLGQLLLFGIFLCYLTLVAFIWIPTKATCGITRFGVGVSYAVCFAVLLVKLMVILTSKSSESLLPGDVESPNYLKGIYQFLMFVFAVGVQVVIAIQWLITVPPEAVKVFDNRGVAVWICNHYTWDASSGMSLMSAFVRTEFENHVLSLVYIMFLILITTLLALNAHGIITNHRESVFIGISAGFSIPIWLAWTLVGGLNKDQAYAQEFGDACIAFGLFLTATLVLFAMFLPKVRQLVNMGVEGIYFEDDRDTYAGSVIMAPPSYKSRPNSVIYVNNTGIYSEPVVIGNGDPSPGHLRHPASTYSAPPVFLKKTPTGSLRGAKTLMVTGDLTGKRPSSKSEMAYATTPRKPMSERGTLKRARSQQDLGAL